MQSDCKLCKLLSANRSRIFFKAGKCTHEENNKEFSISV